MKIFILLIGFALAVNATSDPHDVLAEWIQYKVDFNKSYSAVEDEMRMKLFLLNKDKIEQHNIKYDKGEATFKMGINQYSDWFPREKRALNGFRPSRELSGQEEFQSSSVELPDSINWVEKGAVTSVRNQMRCGSCWAFSTVGAFEGQMYIKTKKLQQLSPQNLVDCCWPFGAMGCSGGFMRMGYECVKYNKGLDTEKSYGYNGVDNFCSFSNKSIGATCTGFVIVPRGDEKSLKEAVATIGPIAVGINVNDAFVYYNSGVLDDIDCSSNPGDANHAVLVVGYNEKPSAENKIPYWLVKNSWGLHWGEKGYVRIAMGKNLCGISNDASYPKV